MPATARKRKFKVGDMVRQIEFGPSAMPRRVIEVGEADYIRVAGLLGWHSARSFVLAP